MTDAPAVNEIDLYNTDDEVAAWADAKCAEAMATGAPFEWYKARRAAGDLRAEAETRFNAPELTRVVLRLICNAHWQAIVARGQVGQ